MHLHRLRRQCLVSGSDFEALTQSMVKMHMKPSAEFHRVVIKLSLLTSPLVPVIKSLMPRTKLMFVTRHIEPSIESFERVLMHIPSDHGAFWFAHLPFPYDDPDFGRIQRKYEAVRSRLPNFYSLALGYGAAMMIFLDNKDAYSHSLVYEELVGDPRARAAVMLRALGISEDMAGEALKGLDSDS